MNSNTSLMQSCHNVKVLHDTYMDANCNLITTTTKPKTSKQYCNYCGGCYGQLKSKHQYCNRCIKFYIYLHFHK